MRSSIAVHCKWGTEKKKREKASIKVLDCKTSKMLNRLWWSGRMYGKSVDKIHNQNELQISSLHIRVYINKEQWTVACDKVEWVRIM